MARFDIPDRVKIRGKWWAVERGANLDGRTDVVGHDPPSKTAYWAGLCDRATNTVLLSHRVRGRRIERVTLLHELMHACSKQSLGPKREEKFLSEVDEALLAAIEALPWR